MVDIGENIQVNGAERGVAARQWKITVKGDFTMNCKSCTVEHSSKDTFLRSLLLCFKFSSGFTWHELNILFHGDFGLSFILLPLKSSSTHYKTCYHNYHSD